MPNPVRILSLIVSLLAAYPAAAQQRPDLDRLEELRFERMREALDLSEQQVVTLRPTMEELRRRNRELREGHDQAMERLREALQSGDEAAVEDALAAMEQRRAEAQELRRRNERRLAEVLRPDQRARFHLFNEQFDSRLRELIERHRRRGAAARDPGFQDGGDPVWMQRDRGRPPPPRGEEMRRFEQRLENLSPEARRREIERLRSEIERLERRLGELEAARP